MNHLLSEHLYINAPFCPRHCSFCNFFTTSTKAFQRYFPGDTFASLLIRELDLFQETLSPKLKSLYLGGGTPLALTSKAVSPFLEKMFKKYDLSKSERTIEVNADPVDSIDEYLGWFNRISIGVQSFHKDNLQIIGRPYTVDLDYIHTLRDQCQNLSIDLLQDIPGEFRLIPEIEEALAFAPNHLSLYSLESERLEKVKKIPPPKTVAQTFREFLDARDFLAERGYANYEISNFAKQGFQSIHNQAYWKRKRTTGLGPGAVGTVSMEGKKIRYTNETDLRKYADLLASNQYPWKRSEIIDLQKEQNEFIMLSLRQKSGLDKEIYFREFGLDFDREFKDELKKHRKYLKNDDTSMRMTHEGWLFFNLICADFFR